MLAHWLFYTAAIWIGPAQQSDSRRLCRPWPCSICWPLLPGAQCNVARGSFYENITLRNIRINQPSRSIGVLLGDEDTPIRNLSFDNVVVTNDPITASVGSLFPAVANLPVEDSILKRIHVFFIWSALGLLLLIGLSFLCVFYGYVNDRRLRCGHWSSCGSRLWLAFAVVVCVLGTGVLRFSIVQDRIYQPARYFICRGVVNGVARGSTWPVPSCFRDETESSTNVYAVEHQNHLSIFCTVVAMITAIGIGIHEFNREPATEYRPVEESAADVPFADEQSAGLSLVETVENDDDFDDIQLTY